MPLKTTQTLTQASIPSWGSGTLLPPLGGDGGVKTQREQLTWALILGTSAGADFHRCFGHIFVPCSKKLIYISASSQRRTRNEKIHIPWPTR